MKKYIKPLLTGILVTLVMVVVMLKITMNFQILLFFGAALFFIAGLINSNPNKHYLLSAILISIFYLSLFILLVLEEIPELWYFVPLYFASALLGVLHKKSKRRITIALSLLSLIMLFMVIKIIPDDIENSLTQIRFDKLPQFLIYDLSGEVVNSENLKGKVVILDFFGTWCKPCVLELKELDKIKRKFKEDDDVLFYIINADIGGDTPEKFEKFIEKNKNYQFQYAYDHDSKIYKQLQLQNLGLPTLLIIDKDQNIRIQHVGYNAAETNFAESMIEKINSLK